MLAFAFSFALWSFASAHATIVIGTLTVEPNPPPAGSPFAFDLTLDDPTGVPVEDAIVLAELTPIGADTVEEPVADPVADPVEVTRFAEVAPGRYRADATVPVAGRYRVLLRDQTFREEEATHFVSLPVGTGAQVEPIDFQFPPTATGSGVVAWLLWLVAIPVVAGIVVTVLVLRGGPSEPDAQPGPKR